MAFELIGRTELSTSASEILLTIPAKRFLHVEIFAISSGSVDQLIQFNGDSALANNNYHTKHSINGAAYSAGTSQDYINATPNAVSTSTPAKVILDITNFVTIEKEVIIKSICVGTAGAGNVPDRSESFAKWKNTTNQITSVRFFHNLAGSFSAGSYMKIWGTD